jgi:hypothetical protein
MECLMIDNHYGSYLGIKKPRIIKARGFSFIEAYIFLTDVTHHIVE